MILSRVIKHNKYLEYEIKRGYKDERNVNALIFVARRGLFLSF